MSKEYPLSVQIGELEREIAMRARTYPELIRKGKMKQADADNRVKILCEAVKTLQQLRKAELAVADARQAG